VAKYADGWMTNKVTPEEFKSQWARILAMAKEEGRDPSKLGSSLYHNININENRQAALDESKAFLDKYYTSNFSMKFVEGFTTAGSPQQCITELKAYFDAGIEHITLRMTSWEQEKHLKRFLEEVVPAFK
jgi:alkanesulfonate monooxygenase SsuD/methylene tetrahydromethanopterin reductase-like flavin-dependent oxidoreductase (luciferase family)